MAKVFAAAFLVLTSVQAQASDRRPDPYFTIESVEVTRLEELTSIETRRMFGLSDPLASQVPSVGTKRIELSAVVNTARKVWDFVNANAPVVNVKTDMANAVPKGQLDWTDFSGWDAPRTRGYRVAYKNRMGMTVVDFSYRILYTGGGSYNGKGLYLNHITSSVENLEVAWGYRFDAEVEVPSVTNSGTAADPIAAAEVQVRWLVRTPIKQSRGSRSFYLRGNGEFRDLTSGER